ncbi:MAG: hypothetical protein ABSF55_03855 [Candidatus Staskawiczbacteria bacterium]|jgi:hypothetical protein
MATLIFGLILLAVPFLLIDLFSDRKRGFIYVLFFLLLFQTILAILTQSLGIFYYWVVATCTLVFDAVLLFLYFTKKDKKNFSFNFKNIDWVIIIVAAISIFCLYQVHYNYTGKISSATDQVVSYHQVKNMAYPYPYFSDEWYAVSLVEGAISTHSLPVKNLLDNTFFPNLELFFHSFVAEIMLLLGLNPLLQYTILLIFFNTLIVLLVYLFLRLSNISKLAAGICSLLALYITYGANLPGLWQFIPFNLGIIFFLLCLCFMEFGDAKTVFLSFVLASLFYPPLIPFYFVALIIFLFCRLKMPKEHLLKVTGYGLLSLFFIIPIIYILLMLSPLANTVNYIFSRIFFISFVAPFIPQLYFYNIMPIPAILLAIFGLYYIYKNKKWVLLSVFISGVIFWFFYSFTIYRFFAEYERIAIFTSIIVVVIAGFGLRQLEDYIKFKLEKNGDKVLETTEIIILFVFLLLAPFYTRGENWEKLVEIYPANGSAAYPKSPANNYLTQDDLKIFKNIKNKRFLSIPWKGTVIGVATRNYPVLTKQGTISLGSDAILNNFLQADCVGKEDMAKKLKLDYIYIYPFDCPDFKKIDESKEGLILYNFL